MDLTNKFLSIVHYIEVVKLNCFCLIFNLTLLNMTNFPWNSHLPHGKLHARSK